MKKDIISLSKNIIKDFTPLYKDCGLLCDNKCCRGDEYTGMLLFPGEDTPFPVKEKNGVRLCVCKGRCSRDNRPLSCMLFPFFPYLSEDGRIEVKADYRGYNICPMIEHREKIRFNKAFLRRVARVGRLLSKDEECRKFLRETSRELEMLERFYE